MSQHGGGGGNALVYHFTHPAPTALRIKSKSEFDYGGVGEIYESWCRQTDTTSRARARLSRLFPCLAVVSSTRLNFMSVVSLIDENICDITC